jgi:hypothetical protein
MEAEMEYVREERCHEECKELKFVILRFTCEKCDKKLTDKVIRSIMVKENLRPVTQEEFGIFESLRRFGCRSIAFGNTFLRPSVLLDFAYWGVPYLTTDGNLWSIPEYQYLDEDYVWDDKWEYIFAPVGQSFDITGPHIIHPSVRLSSRPSALTPFMRSRPRG